MRELSDSVDAAAEVLNRLGGRWALIGALAALEYRNTPRLTTDVDILADNVDGLAEAFEASGFEARAIADSGEEPYLLLLRGHGHQIDILLNQLEYQDVALDRATDHVITAEDVILHKLIAWRPRDRNDIVSILEAGHPLDANYIEQWASAWQVLDRWEQARASR